MSSPLVGEIERPPFVSNAERNADEHLAIPGNMFGMFRVTQIIVLLTVALGVFPLPSDIAAQEQATETQIDDDIDFSPDETWTGDLNELR